MENITDHSSDKKSQSNILNQAQTANPLHKEDVSLPKNLSIKGWGIDANPKNDPTYPMRQRSEDANSNQWQRPPQQFPTTEVLRSIERPNLPAVFGTSSPPTGLSGVIRRFAFKFSEGSPVHWLALVFADRVNVMEGIVEDIGTGRILNFFSDKGIKAQWQHDSKAVIKKAVIGVAIAGALVLVARSCKRNRLHGKNKC